MKYLLVLLTAVCFAQRPVYVTKVIDGDTFVAEGKHYRIAEIDAPELTQAYGETSKIYLTYLIYQRVVQIKPIALDRYRRPIVKLWLRNKYIPELMVNAGMAHWYSKYSKSQKLKQLQDKARAEKKGIWSTKIKPIDPYRYRIGHKYYKN